MDVTFPYLETLFKSVPNNRKKILTQLKSINYFFVNNKSKTFNVTENVLMMLYIGETIEM